MNDYKSEERQDRAEQINEKIAEMQEKLLNSINQAMVSTAENLDKAADKMHKTAEFFREKDADAIKENATSLIKKYPAQSLAAALLFGFIFGKAISR